jgi:enoyl-CoA hydratase/carnithine racemase
VIDAVEAHRIGLVSRVSAHESLMADAMTLGHRIAANPPLAIGAIKRGLRRSLDPDWFELGQWVSETLGQLFRTADHREGVAAFLEKRPAHYTGE